MAANDDVASEFIALTVDLLGFTETIRYLVLDELLQLERTLEKEIREADVLGVASTAWRAKRRDALIEQVRSTIATVMGSAAGTLVDQLVPLAEIATVGSISIINDVFDTRLIRMPSVATSAERYKAIVSDVMIQGAPTADWWAKLENDTALRVASQIRQGFIAGETNDQIVARIRGKPTGSVVTGPDGTPVRQYAGGVMTSSFQEVDAIVRTAATSVGNAAYLDVYRANSDIIRGIAAQVTLDNRTSDVCISRSGGAWDLDGNPLPESRTRIRFPGPPPWHWRCRTYLIPVLKSWDAILRDVPDLPQIPTGTQSSLDGQVPAHWNYEDWLKTKPEAFQRRVLGDERYKLWKAGNLSLSHLVDQRGNPLSLKQLRSRWST